MSRVGDAESEKDARRLMDRAAGDDGLVADPGLDLYKQRAQQSEDAAREQP